MKTGGTGFAQVKLASPAITGPVGPEGFGMTPSKWEGIAPLTFTGEAPPNVLAFDDELTVETLTAVEQTLFANPNNEPAIRLLACHVRQIGERLIAAEDELRMIRNASYLK